MAVKCDVCGKMTNKYFTTYAGDVVCSKTCQTVYQLESYLLRMEERRQRDEAHNETAFDQARQMSAWLSLFKYGNVEQKKRAIVAINAWAK